MTTRSLAHYMAETHDLDWAAIRAEHRMTWKWRNWQDAPGVWHTGNWGASVRSTGFDATCSCGWESRTGGAVKADVDRQIEEHLQDVVLAEMPKEGIA